MDGDWVSASDDSDDEAVPQEEKIVNDE